MQKQRLTRVSAFQCLLAGLAIISIAFGPAQPSQAGHGTTNRPVRASDTSEDFSDDAAHEHDATCQTSDHESETAELELVKVSQFHMGMMVHITVYAEDRPQGLAACRAAFERVRAINMIMSDYEPKSELSQLCRKAGQGPVETSEKLFEVLSRGKRLAELTDGLYDPTAAPIVRLWRQARRDKKLPDTEAVEAAKKLVGYEMMKLDAKARTVELTKPGMRLDLGAIAKGYAGDEAIKVLRAKGITRACFDAGGDSVFGDAPPGMEGWPVSAPHEKLDDLHLANCAISVSGDTVQFLEIDGKRYSHVIDPRTGEGITTRQMCVVIAPDGFTSDPVATIGTLMNEKAYRAMLENEDVFKDVEAHVFPAPREDPEPDFRIPPPDTSAE